MSNELLSNYIFITRSYFESNAKLQLCLLLFFFKLKTADNNTIELSKVVKACLINSSWLIGTSNITSECNNVEIKSYVTQCLFASHHLGLMPSFNKAEFFCI